MVVLVVLNIFEVSCKQKGVVTNNIVKAGTKTEKYFIGSVLKEKSKNICKM